MAEKYWGKTAKIPLINLVYMRKRKRSSYSWECGSEICHRKRNRKATPRAHGHELGFHQLALVVSAGGIVVCHQGIVLMALLLGHAEGS